MSARPMQNAIDAVPYLAATKIGLRIHAPLLGGGRGDLWRHQLHGPADPADRLSEHGLREAGKAVLLGAYTFGAYADEFTSLAARRAHREGRSNGAPRSTRNIANEFENGIAVSWSRAPGALGCFGYWSDEARQQHYQNLCAIDGRIALAGEHASYLPAWQEGAVLSALDAISRLHRRVVGG